MDLSILRYEFMQNAVLAGALGGRGLRADRGLGLLGSYLFHFPSGATIVLVPTLIFIASAAFSPKRRVKKS